MWAQSGLSAIWKVCVSNPGSSSLHVEVSPGKMLNLKLPKVHLSAECVSVSVSLKALRDV